MKKIYFFLLAAVACSLQMNATEGALQGRFTINQNGDQVVFSQGNLQYQASTQTWRFAENQYDYVGDATNGNVYVGETKSDNSLISDTYDGWIDLFGWGTGNAPTKVSMNNNDYMTFTDWGINAIHNGGNAADQWRTLSKAEWNYLFSKRANADNLRGLATVNGIPGYVFLPDGFVVPTDLGFTANPNNWTINVYSATEWQQMETVGAVFLPAAGERIGTEVIEVSEYGHYWSSTQNPISQYQVYANKLDFHPNSIESDGSSNIYYGLSVRLVQAAPVIPTWTVTIVQPEHGTICVEETDVDLDAVPDGTELNFIATPDEGYKLYSWDGGYPGMEITEDVTVTCTFVPDSEGVEEVPSDQGQSTNKILRNGLLLIERNGKTYNALGAEMK